MNLEHKEKQEIFNEYSIKTHSFEKFRGIITDFKLNVISEEKFINHIFNACDIVQKKALERASDNATAKIEEDLRGGQWSLVDKESITNENNLIK